MCSIILILASGCGRGNEEIPQKPDPKVEYEKFLRKTIEESDKMLERYGSNLDKLYIQEYNPEQFAVIVREIINISNELVTKSEQYDADVELFEFHTKVLNYLNAQHELFLVSIDAANQAKGQGDQFNKSNLRQSYVGVKSTQAALMKEWKEMKNPPENNNQQ